MAIVEGLKDVSIPIYHTGDNAEEFDEKKHTWYVPKNTKKLPHYHKRAKSVLKAKVSRAGKLKSYLFYIPAVELKPYGIIIREGIYPHTLIQLLLDEKHITLIRCLLLT